MFREEDIKKINQLREEMPDGYKRKEWANDDPRHYLCRCTIFDDAGRIVAQSSTTGSSITAELEALTYAKARVWMHVMSEEEWARAVRELVDENQALRDANYVLDRRVKELEERHKIAEAEWKRWQINQDCYGR